MIPFCMRSRVLVLLICGRFWNCRPLLWLSNKKAVKLWSAVVYVFIEPGRILEKIEAANRYFLSLARKSECLAKNLWKYCFGRWWNTVRATHAASSVEKGLKGILFGSNSKFEDYFQASAWDVTNLKSNKITLAFSSQFFFPLMLYVVWQVGYLFITGMLRKVLLEFNPPRNLN